MASRVTRNHVPSLDMKAKTFFTETRSERCLVSCGAASGCAILLHFISASASQSVSQSIMLVLERESASMEHLQVPLSRPQLSRRRGLSLPENILQGQSLKPPTRSRRRLSDLSTILEVLPSIDSSSCPEAEESHKEDEDHHHLQASSCLYADINTGTATGNKRDHQQTTTTRTRSSPPRPPASHFSGLVRSVSSSSISLKPRRQRRLSLSCISSSIAASLSAMASVSDPQSLAHHPTPSSPSSHHRSNAPLKSAMRSPPTSAASLDSVTDGMSALGGSSHPATAASSSSDDKASLGSSSAAATAYVQPVVPSITTATTSASGSTTSLGNSNSNSRRRSSHGAYVARVSFDDTNSTGGGGGTGFDQSYTLRATTSGFVRTRESRTFLVATDMNAYSMHALNWAIDSLIEGGQSLALSAFYTVSLTDQYVSMVIIQTEMSWSYSEY